MNKTLKAVSIKYGLIVAGISIIVGLLSTLAAKNASGSGAIFAGVGVALSWMIKIVIFGMSHYEFNRKNNGYISFKDAIIIGLLIIGISHVISIVFSIVNFQLFMKDQYQELSGYGISPVTVILTSSITGILLDIVILFMVITIEAHWKIFRKAGKEGWAALIPIYSTIVMLDIVRKPAGWLIFLLIPVVNIIFAIWMVNLLAKRFGKDEGYTVGMLLLPFVFYPMLGLSEEKMIPIDPSETQYRV